MFGLSTDSSGIIHCTQTVDLALDLQTGGTRSTKLEFNAYLNSRVVSEYSRINMDS
jgi:hypothetical protein